MRVIDLSAPLTIALDFVAWFICHMAAALISLRLPEHWFARDRWLYRTRSWEQQGLFWQQVFRVRSWKERLPDGARLLGRGYAKKRLQATHDWELGLFIRESRRAELTHYLAMLPAPLFFLWNPPAVGWFMILYAILMNAPCVIAQRYNRPRFARLLDQRQAGRSRLNLEKNSR